MKTKPPSPTSTPGTLPKKSRPSTSPTSGSSIPSPTTHRPTFNAPSPSASSSTASPRRRSSGGQISRSISACNRCRSRKTKCDQLFPNCSSCAKAGVECVGIDAATGREVPRSYVDWLEKRVRFLEQEMGISSDGTESNPSGTGGGGVKRKLSNAPSEERREASEEHARDDGRRDKALHLRPDIDNLVSQVGLVSVQGTSAPGFLGGTSGISFARLMFAAVKTTNRDNPQSSQPTSIQSTPAGSSPKPPNADSEVAADSSTQIPRSRQRPAPAPFPRRQVGENYVDIFFNQANPQTPILHRPSFEKVFRQACSKIEEEGGNGLPANGGAGGTSGGEKDHQHRADLYFLYMVFAIATAMSSRTEALPERYHASAMLHMDSLFSSIALTNNRLDGLKGILLLALYSIMRPAAPGVWYVVGAAMRLAIDLGLHQENPQKAEKMWDPLTVDERRRLWWCTYCLDRQICVYLGRPFGIADEAIETPFPVEEVDGWSDAQQIETGDDDKRIRSCRTVSIHIFKIRQIQSEIQQVLYQSVSALPRRFATVEGWRKDVESRLTLWCDSVPKSRAEMSNCGYNLSFIDLNYQQTRLLLHGLCPTVSTPSTEAFEVIADSGSRIIRLYRQLHREKCINYTWLACHNLFMAGTSYLYALWHSREVRRKTTVEQIDFHNLACVDVLGSMIDKCPAAQGCRDVFESLASATVQLCASECSVEHPSAKRVKIEWQQHQHQKELYQQHQQQIFEHESQVIKNLPTSLANIVHVPSPPPAYNHPAPPPTYSDAEMLMPPPPQPYRTDHHNPHQSHYYDAALHGNPVEMMAVMDGRGLFEMMREVGTADPSALWEGNPAGVAGVHYGAGGGMGMVGGGGAELFGNWPGF
ncbi:unnamed protein product [Tuber melanosporum]|uniref:(Perigord truffle) hypothetical protein n=1 Tax=Tuber melanosporum (strain Mel28) TaxID=656061 RepID=D5GC28_TUBMM|nr:uncharacterized protein GSTUM_00005791001 [Tuber melanosporum]CAZ82071.1 unnamed protein product [Tuber melanosporum]